MNLSPKPTYNAGSEWQISAIVNGEKQIIWSGGQEAFPTSTTISTKLSVDTTSETITDIADQVVRNCSISSVHGVLNSLICNYWRSDSLIDIRMLNNTLESFDKAVCGVVFKKGDIVWTCRQCAKDPTSVQCDKCFRQSNHEGHEVYFHRAAGDSGCCDCGDVEAWSKHGNCLSHSHISKDQSNKDVNPVDSLPVELVKGLRAVVKGVIGVMVSHATDVVRGYEKWANNQFIRERESANTTSPLVVRLHNDDVHNIDEVVNAIMGLGYNRQQATAYTTQVDKEGESAVLQAVVGDARLLVAYQRLKMDAGLLVSVTPDSVLARDPKVAAAVTWMLGLGAKHDGIRRIVSEELLSEIHTSDIFNDYNQFPSVITQLMDPSVPRLSLSNPIYVRTQEEIQSVHSGPREEYSADYVTRLTHPFSVCHRDALGIILMSSPFLSKTLKKLVVETVIKFQHDAVFKAGFSQQFSSLYPALCVLHCRNIGTLDTTIFHTSVQVFTSNAVVALMSSDGVRNRLLPEVRPVMITKMLMSTFIAILRDVGCKSEEELGSGQHDDSFLSHHAIHTHRIAQICRDMEYVTSDSFFCARLLRGDVDYGLVGDLLDICALLQNIDSHRRITTVHVEQETDRWQDAANLVLEFESISTHLVSAALFDPSSTKSDKTSQFSYSKLYDSNVDDDITTIREIGVRDCTTQAIRAIRDWGVRHHSMDVDDAMYFRAENSADTCLGHPVVFSGIKRYQVSHNSVSVHLPLHRFLSKLLTYGAYGNISMYESLTGLCRSDIAGRVEFADYPLRCLAFSTQVLIGMWRRNGAATANLSYNYTRAPLSKVLRDMDIIAVQTSIYTLTPDSLLTLAIDRFELAALLNNYQLFYTPLLPSASHPEINKEFQAPVLNEFLRTLIHVVTNTPMSLVGSQRDESRPTEGCRRALGREIVHHVLTGVNSAGQLQKVKMMIGSNATVSDVMLTSAIDDVCIRKVGDDDVKTLQLRPESYVFYDPEYSTLSTQQASQAADRMRERAKNATSEANDSNASASDLNQKFLALVSAQGLPIPCEEFTSMRCILYRPMMFTLLHRTLRICIDNAEATKTSRLTIIGRVIHLVTLQIVCKDTPLHSMKNASYISPNAWNSGTEYFAEAFKDTADGGNGNGVEMMRSNSSGNLSSGNSKPSASEMSVLTGVGRNMLIALTEVWTAGLVKDDILYHHGLGWILQQIVTHSPDGRELLRSRGISYEKGTTSAETDDAAEKKRKRMLAQQRAMMESQKRAAAFAMSAADEDSDEDDEDESGAEGGDREPEPECIVCREKKSDSAMGFLCFLQPSHMLKNTMKSNLDCPQLNNVYRVTAMAGCDVFLSPSTVSDHNNKSIYHLQQSDHVLSGRRAGVWLHITAPVTGWCKVYNPPEKSGGEHVVNLVPISDLMFNHHGGARLHVSNCGHTMHFDCWNMFYAANYSRYVNGHRSADFLAMDIERNESLCPLCKSVTNTLLPYTSKKKAAELLDVASDSQSQHVNQSNVVKFLAGVSDTVKSGGIFSKVVLCNPYDLPAENNTKGKMFYESCLTLNNLPWNKSGSRGETAFMRLGQAAHTENIRIIRSLHSVWTMAAYTLQCNTLKMIRDRQTSSNSVSKESNDERLALNDSESALFNQLLCMLRHCPSWFERDADFHDYISTPLGVLIFNPQQLSSTVSSGCRVMDAALATKADIESCLLTLPYRSVSTPGYPSTQTIAQIMTLGHSKGIASKDLYAVLKVPLLAQDLNMVAIAVASSSSSLNEFRHVSGIISLARLAQILIETAAIDTTSSGNSTSNNPHAKAETDSNISPLLQPENRKKLKVDAFPGSVSVFHTSNESMDMDTDSAVNNCHGDLQSSVEGCKTLLASLRNTLFKHCDITGKPHLNVDELVHIVLDSWLPFMEYLHHLNAVMSSVCQHDDQSNVITPINIVDSTDAIKWAYAVELLKQLHIASLLDTINSSEFQGLLTQWAKHLLVFQGNQGGSLTSSSSNSWIPSQMISRPQAIRSTSLNHGEKAKKGEASPVVRKLVREASDSQAAASAAVSSNIAVANSENEFDNIMAMLSGSNPPSDNGAIGGNSGVNNSLQNHTHDDDTNVMDDDEYSYIHGSSRVEPVLMSTDFNFQHHEDEGENADDSNNDDDDDETDDYLEELLMRGDTDTLDEDIDDDEADDDDLGDDLGDDDDDEEEEDEETEGAVNNSMEQQLLAQLLAGGMDPANGGFVGASENLRDEILAYLNNVGYPAAFSATATAADAKKKTAWKLYGVDPTNELVDESFPRDRFMPKETLSCFHTRNPLQGSVSGLRPVYGLNGERLSHGYPDLSHMGVGCRHVIRAFVELPHVYTDLYQMTKFPDGPDGVTLEDPAICLVCGRVLNAGNRQDPLQTDREGECTQHTQQCGVGVGIFFLVQTCSVLLLRGSLACYYPSFYLDSAGEVNDRSGQNRPLFLSQKRYKKLEDLYLGHQISKEIARKRSTADSVIRANWY